MAEKRMFTKTIVESGAFYNLSPKAQCLYLHLNMNADDDGVLNNAINICRSLGFSKNILQELIDARFVLDLSDGITVIKHWKMNNTIAKDRYKPSIYKDVVQKLYIKDNKSYTDNIQEDNIMDAKCLQNDYTDKNRIGIDKNRDDDINNINGRMLEIGTDPSTINKALKIYANKNYPKTSGFYQRILNVLTDANIYDKEAYISEVARNYVLD